MSEEVKIGDSQDHQDCSEVEKIAENCYQEVFDSMAVKVYGHWIRTGVEDLQQSRQKSRGRTLSETRARAKLLKSKI